MPYSYRKQITQQENPYLILSPGKPKVFTKFQNKAVGFGMGTLVSIAQKKKKKNVFREDLSHKDL